jgi:hypothetical protein
MFINDVFLMSELNKIYVLRCCLVLSVCYADYNSLCQFGSSIQSYSTLVHSGTLRDNVNYRKQRV